MDLDQLASQKQADLDLCCFQTGYISKLKPYGDYVILLYYTEGH